MSPAKFLEALLLADDGDLGGLHDGAMFVRWKGEVNEDMGNALMFLTQASVEALLVKNTGLFEMLAVMPFLCICACCLACIFACYLQHPFRTHNISRRNATTFLIWHYTMKEFRPLHKTFFQVLTNLSGILTLTR